MVLSIYKILLELCLNKETFYNDKNWYDTLGINKMIYFYYTLM